MEIKSGYKENGSPTMEIKTDRLIIRPLGPEYLETYNAYAMSLENARYMCFLPQKDEEESMEFLKAAAEEWLKPDPKFYEFAIIHNGEHIGGISVHMEYGKPVLGWIINKDYWGQGFAYESAKAVMDHFANELGIRYFCARSDKFVLITSNKEHPAFKVQEDNLHIIFQPEFSLKEALETLKKDYGCQRITIQSGGTLNGIFLREKLFDYVDIVVAPVLVGGKDTATLIDGQSLTKESELSALGVLELFRSGKLIYPPEI